MLLHDWDNEATDEKSRHEIRLQLTQSFLDDFRGFHVREVLTEVAEEELQWARVAEIAKATDWQNHSIRGFIAGQLTKKMGLTVESTKNQAGEWTYRITQ